MSEKNENIQTPMGQKVYETIIKMFDGNEYKYDRHDEDHVVTCLVGGDDLPMEMLFVVHDQREVVQVISPMPFRVPEDKRTEIALATTLVNDRLIHGSFDFNLLTGRIVFRLTTSFVESILGPKMFDYMLNVSAATVDDYNDKFMMISKGIITFEQFLESETKDDE